MTEKVNYLLLRGLSRETEHWFDFPERLQEYPLTNNVYCLDLPGFGSEIHRASPQNIKEIMMDVRARWEKIDKPEAPAIAVGQSLGAMVLLCWADIYPEDFKHMVIINTSAADKSPPWERLNLSVLFKSPLSLLGGIEVEERVILGHISNIAKKDYNTIKKWVAIRRKHPFDYKNVFRQLYAASKYMAPDKIKVPLTFFASKKDRLVSSKCSVKLANQYNAKVHINNQAGHDLPLDDPDWVLDKLQSVVEPGKINKHG